MIPSLSEVLNIFTIHGKVKIVMDKKGLCVETKTTLTSFRKVNEVKLAVSKYIFL